MTDISGSSAILSNLWTRRDWVTCNAAAFVATRFGSRPEAYASSPPVPPSWDTLAEHAVDAAKRAGAHYADARLMHTLFQQYTFTGPNIGRIKETVGVGIRALVNGYWGFAATPGGNIAEVERLARAAVAQAKVNAQGTPRTIDLGVVPPAVGTWKTPVKIDPFTVPIEEKLAMMQYWMNYASQCGVGINPMLSNFYFVRQEYVMANSEGAHFTQTLYESGGKITVQQGQNETLLLLELTPRAKGWELLLDADIPGQLRTIGERFDRKAQMDGNSKSAQIGRYTLVCDGPTMASLMDRTLAIATQLDRALGYEANASGTSYLNDPLEMLGTFKAASPLVTITANRSAQEQLGTVKWDAEGVEPQPFTLVKDGILVDYQTTREQAAWLKPYYDRQGIPVRSHGCAAVESATLIPMQHVPNLAMTPNANDTTIEALIANVKDGILVCEGKASSDFQARAGELQGTLYAIKDGKVRRLLQGGAVLFDALDLWRGVVAVGGASTLGTLGATRWPWETVYLQLAGWYPVKGQPPQMPSYTVQAPAATITNQAVIDLWRRA